MKQFKIRASAVSQIMSQPRNKKDKEAGLLGETAKSYCKTWLIEQIYNRKKEFSNKYTEKGIKNEDLSIDFLIENSDFGFMLKNEENFESEYMTGTPDIILNNLIIDVKNSWDCFTFPLFETETPNKAYYWQAQAYMSMLGVANYKLIYILTDTPKELIEQEAYYFAKKNNIEFTKDLLDEFTEKLTYSNISAENRIKIFDIKRNFADIIKIEEQVKKCRNYIKTLV